MADNSLPLYAFTTQEDWYGELEIQLTDPGAVPDLTGRSFEMHVTVAAAGGVTTAPAKILKRGDGLEFKQGTNNVLAFTLDRDFARTLPRGEFTADLLEVVGGDLHLFLPVRIRYSEPAGILAFLSRALRATYAANRQPVIAPLGVPGTPGSSGKTIITGTAAPTGAVGNVGDYYIRDQSANGLGRTMYGPKVGTAWGTPWSIEAVGGFRDVDNFEIRLGFLWVTYSDGVETNLGKVVGADGVDGVDGTNGTNGTNGRGVVKAEIISGRLLVTFTDSADPVDVGPVGTGSGSGGGPVVLPVPYYFSLADGNLTDGQTVFPIPGGYVGAKVDVFVNGARSFKNEFSASNGSTVSITYPTIKAADDTVVIVVLGPVGSSGGGTGGGTALQITVTPAGGFSATNVQAALEEIDSEGLKKANNLSGLTDKAAARANLELGSAATLSAGVAAGNVPVLDGNGLLLASLLPALAITDTFPVASQVEMLALTAQRGDVAIRTDSGTAYILRTEPATTLANWIALSSAGQGILSIAGLTSSTISALQLIGALQLTIGTNVQAQDSDLQAIADQGTVAYGRGLLALADQPALAGLLRSAAAELWALQNVNKFLTPKVMADAMAFTPQTWAATLLMDWTGGFNRTVTSAGLTTFSGPFVGGVDGEPISIEYVQPATGGGGLAFNGTYFKLPTGLTITASTAANAVDIIDGQLRLIGGTMVCQIRSFTKGAR